ncbi:nuclear transport factor 2 family protein [Actinophytocola sediminis]
MNPRKVATSLLDAISRGSWSDLPDLYAEDAVVEQPFSQEPVVLAGRAAVAAHFAGAANLPLRVTATNVVLHETADQEVVIVEYDYLAENTTTGHTSTVHNIQVLRVRAGRIVASRDYHDHAALARAAS